MADQAITALPKKTYSGSSKIAATDYLLGIDSAEGYQMLIQDLGEYIINRVTASLAGSNQTLAAAISALNSNSYSLKSGTNAASGADFNTYITPGIYFVTSNTHAAGCTNCPSGRAGRLIVEWTTGASTVLRQTYVEYAESANVPTANVYVRVSDNGASGWRAWQKQPTRTEIDALNSNLYNANLGTAINNNDDLDTYTKPGTYYCNSSSKAATLAHCPVNSSGFKLLVILTGYERANLIQIIEVPIGLNDGGSTYRRMGNPSSWGTWVKSPTRSEVDSLNSNTVQNDKGGADVADYLQIGFDASNAPEIRVHNKTNHTWYHESLAPLNQSTNIKTLSSKFAINTLPADADANDSKYREAGFHMYSGAFSNNRTNFASAYKGGTFIDLGSTDMHWQFCCHYDSPGILYFRNYYQNWKEWKQLTSA